MKFIIMLIFLFGILVSLLGFSVLRSLKAFLFGAPKGKSRPRTSASQQRQRTEEAAGKQRSARRKIIPEKEGEYVDYEEIK
jgi:hypothetical protein